VLILLLFSTASGEVVVTPAARGVTLTSTSGPLPEEVIIEGDDLVRTRVIVGDNASVDVPLELLRSPAVVRMGDRRVRVEGDLSGLVRVEAILFDDAAVRVAVEGRSQRSTRALALVLLACVLIAAATLPAKFRRYALIGVVLASIGVGGVAIRSEPDARESVISNDQNRYRVIVARRPTQITISTGTLILRTLEQSADVTATFDATTRKSEMRVTLAKGQSVLIGS